MLPENKRNTNLGIAMGILLEFAGRLLASRDGIFLLLGVVVALAGVAAFIWGCMNYAEGKGHVKWLGWLGLLSIFGFIVLVTLPDHYKGVRSTARRTTS